MRQAKVNMMGGWIQIVDAETGEMVHSMNIPRYGKPDAFVRRAVRWGQKNGYLIPTCKGMEGNDVIKIG